MNNNLLKRLLLRENLFVPLIFTRKQFDVMRRYVDKKSLSNAEKKAMYTSISKKIKALNSLYKENEEKEFFIMSRNKIINSRIIEAKELIKQYSKYYDKIFISGSFLFSKEYNDIDIFILVNRGYKEEWDGKRHLIYLTEKKLSQPIFQSAILMSVSNFIISTKMKKIKPKLSELMSTYHESLIEFLRKDKKSEMTRRLIFDYELFCNDNILDPQELKQEIKKININRIDFAAKKLFERLFSKSYLYIELHKYIGTLKKSITVITPNFHLKHFKNKYEELIYGSARNQEATA